jgi:hypothetical protein
VRHVLAIPKKVDELVLKIKDKSQGNGLSASIGKKTCREVTKRDGPEQLEICIGVLHYGE